MTVRLHHHTKVCVVWVCFCFDQSHTGAINPADINSFILSSNRGTQDRLSLKAVAPDPLVAVLFHTDGVSVVSGSDS